MSRKIAEAEATAAGAAAVGHVDREGLKLKFTTDPRKALELPTARAAHGLRRLWRMPGSKEDLVKVRRRTRTTP